MLARSNNSMSSSAKHASPSRVRSSAVMRPTDDMRVRAIASRRPLSVQAVARQQQAYPTSSWRPQQSSVLPSRALVMPAPPPSPAQDLWSPTEAWSSLQGSWDGLAARKKLLLASHLGFVLSNMDKINLTIAIIPMAEHFGWTSSVSGLVQSAFFFGCVLMQLPGGYLTQKLGGSRTLPASVAVWSAATFCMPMLAATVPSLCLTRAVVGLGEAVAPTAIVDMVARTVPAAERSSATSLAFGGLHIGSIVGLLASPVIIDLWGWEPLFYVFGGAGALWYLWFQDLIAGIGRSEPEVLRMLSGRVWSPAEVQAAAGASDGRPAGTEAALAAASRGSSVDSSNLPQATRALSGERIASSSSAGGEAEVAVPYRALLRSRPVQALMFTHFCNNWFSYTFLAWLPTYFTDTLSVDLMHAAQTALLPPLAGIAASAAAGSAADALIKRHVPLALVRKSAQSIAFLAPMACLLAVSFMPEVSESRTLTVAAITAALGLSSFSLAGLYCTHQDLSPKYSSSMLSLTNTAGAVPGIVGVASVGLMFDATHSWELSLFLPSAVLLGAGALVYNVWGRNDPIDFDAMDNGPLAAESWPAAVASGASKLWGRVAALL